MFLISLTNNNKVSSCVFTIIDEAGCVYFVLKKFEFLYDFLDELAKIIF